MKSHPEIIGSYNIIETLGRGGMGIVYRARHFDTNQEVALKTITLPKRDLLGSIRREIISLARIRHPGIVKIIEEGVHDGLPWYAMELIQGVTLRHFFSNIVDHPGVETKPSRSLSAGSDVKKREKKSPYEWWMFKIEEPGFNIHTAQTISQQDSKSRAINDKYSIPVHGIEDLDLVITIIHRLCAPLAYLHGEGLVHRDLKPENIFITPDGMPVLFDFGLVSQYSDDIARESLSIEQNISGTVSYMAPEQLRGKFVDARADLYSLGCILYELLVGHPPFEAELAKEIIKSRLNSDPIRPSQLRADLDPELDDLVLRLLSRDPRDRLGYADTVASLLAKLGAVTDDTEVVRPRPYLYRSSFTGRSRQMAILEDNLQNLMNDQGGLVLIAGESGVGKTRLALEFSRDAINRDFLVLTGESTDNQSYAFSLFKKPLLTIADICRERGRQETDRILGERGKILASYESSLGGLPGQDNFSEPVELPAEAARNRIFSSFITTLSELTRERPLLLILDDLQWADELSLDFLMFLVQHDEFNRFPILILGTYRSESLTEKIRFFQDNEKVLTIELNRFNEAAISDIIEDMLALSSPVPEFSRYLHKHSEGNPFFVAEYLRTTVEEGIILRDEMGQWSVKKSADENVSLSNFSKLPIPKSVKTLVQRRITGLPISAESVLQSAAVVGREFDIQFLEEMMSFKEEFFYEGIEELFRRHILEQSKGDLIRFSHDKIREIAYTILNPDVCEKLHRAAAETIETFYAQHREEYFSILGHHWEQAGEQEHARHYYLKGARWAREHYSYHEAERLFKCYFNLIAKPSSESIDVRIELVYDIYTLLGRHQEAMQELEQGLIEAKKIAYIEGEASIYQTQSIIFRNLGKLDKAREFSTQSIKLIRELGSRKNVAKALNSHAIVCSVQGRFEEALLAYDEALTIARELNDQEFESNVLGNIASLRYEQGKISDSQKLHLEALAIQKELGLELTAGRSLCNLGIISMEQDNFEESRTYFEEALVIHSKVGDKRYEGITLSNLGTLYTTAGNVQEARFYLEQALVIIRELEDKRVEGIILGNLANLPDENRPAEERIQLFDQSISSIHNCGDRRAEALTIANKAKLLVELGMIEHAQECYENARELSNQINQQIMEARFLIILSGLVRQAYGEIEKATEYLNKARIIVKKSEDIDILILLHCQEGHLRLADQISAHNEIIMIQNIEQSINAELKEETQEHYVLLQNAQKTFEKQEYDLLFRGECYDDFPPGMKKYVENQKS